MTFKLPGHTLPGPNQKGSPNKIWATLIIGAIKAGAKAYMGYKKKKQDEKVAAIEARGKGGKLAASKVGTSNKSRISVPSGNVPSVGKITPVPTGKLTG